MQPIVKDTQKDATRPAKLNNTENVADNTEDSAGNHPRLNKIANDMASRGTTRERKDEEGKDVISK